MDAGRAAPTLLGIFAHPDDESLACGGLFARAAAAGVKVVIVSLTRGEAGPGHETGAALGMVRTAEFAAAAAVLGAAAVELRDHADGMLPWIAPDVLVADLDALIAAHRPDAVVTFDADGLYWHPDHLAVHERTTDAVAALGSRGPALFYVSLPPGQMQAVVARTGGRAPILPGLDDPAAFGAGAPPPTLVVDAGAQAADKLAAIHCHRSQVAHSALAALTRADAALIAVEHYRRAPVGDARASFLEGLGAPPATRRPDHDRHA